MRLAVRSGKRGRRGTEARRSWGQDVCCLHAGRSRAVRGPFVQGNGVAEARRRGGVGVRTCAVCTRAARGPFAGRSFRETGSQRRGGAEELGSGRVLFARGPLAGRSRAVRSGKRGRRGTEARRSWGQDVCCLHAGRSRAVRGYGAAEAQSAPSGEGLERTCAVETCAGTRGLLTPSCALSATNVSPNVRPRTARAWPRHTRRLTPHCSAPSVPLRHRVPRTCGARTARAWPGTRVV